MHQVHDYLFVGDDVDCRSGSGEWAVVHACKSPCHQRAVGYRGSLSPHHPNYLVLERGGDLYLNMIDPPVPLFMPPLFTSFLAFASRHSKSGKKILIHCNLGESRAPSLALLFLAKCTGMISNDSYAAARAEFVPLCPGYTPGLGIQMYLTQHWREFDAL
ncbi:MAG: hypothetical protein ABIH26_00385 [Candidatus Eisenbacteria bacterium]